MRALEAVARWLRGGGALLESEPAPIVRLRLLVEVLEEVAVWRRALAAAVARVCADGDALPALEAGLPNDRGLWPESSDRLARRLLPAADSARDLGALVSRMFPTMRDARLARLRARRAGGAPGAPPRRRHARRRHHAAVRAARRRRPSTSSRSWPRAPPRSGCRARSARAAPRCRWRPRRSSSCRACATRSSPASARRRRAAIGSAPAATRSRRCARTSRSSASRSTSSTASRSSPRTSTGCAICSPSARRPTPTRARRRRSTWWRRSRPRACATAACATCSSTNLHLLARKVIEHAGETGEHYITDHAPAVVEDAGLGRRRRRHHRRHHRRQVPGAVEPPAALRRGRARVGQLRRQLPRSCSCAASRWRPSSRR